MQPKIEIVVSSQELVFPICKQQLCVCGDSLLNRVGPEFKGQGEMVLERKQATSA